MFTLAKKLDVLAAVGCWDWPEDARETILAGLRSEDPEHRRAALEVAADAMDDEMAATLLELLDSDPDPELRGRAAIVLGPALEEGRDDEGLEGGPFATAPLSPARFAEVERRLERLYRDAAAPKLVRRRALEAAVRSDRPWQEGAVRSAWASDDADWRLTAVFCMGLLPGFEAEIEEALGSDRPELEREAVRAAGSRGLEKLGDEIYRRAASETGDRGLRMTAIEALAYINPPGTRGLLEKLARSDDRELADEAEAALEELVLTEMADRVDLDGFGELDDFDDFLP